MLYIWFEFFLMALLIIIFGTLMSKFADVIADKTGFGQVLIGGILLALATSLPELVTSITSSIVEAPDIAIGNVFGSNAFNLMILAFVDLLHGSGPLMLRVRYSHILSGLFGILLSAIVTISIIIYHFTSFSFGIMNVGLDSFIILFTYIFGIRLIFRYEKKNPLDQDLIEKNSNMNITLKKAISGFLMCSIVIVFAGIRLSIAGEKIAALTGIEESFIGSILVAAATSLPELVASISAINIGAYNMAIGNVFGSNIFNMLIVFFADIFYRPSYILSSININHIITAMIALMMSTIALIGLFYRSKRTIFNIGLDSLFISITYLFGVYLLFRLGVDL